MRHDSVLRVVELIYAAACEPALWPQALGHLSDLAGATGTSLAAFDLGSSTAQIHVGIGIVGPNFQREYPTFSASDPLLLRARERGAFRTGFVGLGSDMISHQELERTSFYQDFGKRHGYGLGMSGIMVADAARAATVSLCEHPKHRFDARHVKLMRVLLPHFQRAWQVHRRLVGADGHRSSMRDTLNHIAAGTILVGPGGSVLFANDSARAVLRAQDGLHVDRGSLRAAKATDTAALRSLISGALETGGAGGLHAGGVLRLPRPSGRQPLTVIVSPLPPTDAFDDPVGRAIVFVTAPDEKPEPDEAILRRAFGLTAAEAGVACLLLQDKTVAEISHALGVTTNTVRFHLKQLFAKVGVRRQSELVRALLTTSQVSRRQPTAES